MSVFGIPPRRLALYGLAAAALVGLNALRYVPGTEGSVDGPEAPRPGALPELPELAVVTEITGFSGPPSRNLFRPGAADAPPPPPAPEPEPEAAPPPDPDARARAEAERALDSVRAIGFLSTGEGVMAVLNVDGTIVNAFRGDTPVPGFTVSEVRIDSVTLLHGELELARTFGLDDEN